jgi:hypothetical protein
MNRRGPEGGVVGGDWWHRLSSCCVGFPCWPSGSGLGWDDVESVEVGCSFRTVRRSRWWGGAVSDPPAACGDDGPREQVPGHGLQPPAGAVPPPLLVNGVARWGSGPPGQALVGGPFGGVLIIDRSQVVFHPRGSATRSFGMGQLVPGPLVHTGRTIVMLRARLMPPWFNTSVILTGDPRRGEATTAAVTVGGWARRRVRRALRGAGYLLIDAATWVSLGGGGNPFELPRDVQASLARKRL